MGGRDLGWKQIWALLSLSCLEARKPPERKRSKEKSWKSVAPPCIAKFRELRELKSNQPGRMSKEASVCTLKNKKNTVFFLFILIYLLAKNNITYMKYTQISTLNSSSSFKRARNEKCSYKWTKSTPVSSQMVDIVLLGKRLADEAWMALCISISRSSGE